MKRAALILLLLGAGCASRPQPRSPYVPPETQYSTGSTLLAAGGLMTAMAGASVAQSPNASKSMQAGGYAAVGAGVGLMLSSLADAIYVRRQREMFWDTTLAFYHHYFGPPPVGEVDDDRPPPPAPPTVPFNFKEETPEPEDP